ncbi:hypothetical protein EV426DRAFT_204468 [Tirmania nivea]|nr:hypothetical protein EV426DRAFT_204468 [Tirmania nivea]
MDYTGPSRLIILSRPSSWGSATDCCRSSSDSGSPSCFTLSTVSGGDPLSAVTSGTLPFSFSDSPISPENSTSSSLAKLAWKPLELNKDRNGEASSSAFQHSKLPPVPKFPAHFTGAATQQVRVETTRLITYSQSIRSEHPNILDTPSPLDVEPLPKTCYVPPKPIQTQSQYPIGTALGSATMSADFAMRETLHTDIIPGKTAPPRFPDTLHTDIIPGKTMPPKLPEVESPAAESFYQGSNAPTQASRSSTPQTQATSISTPHTQGTVNTTPLTQATTKYDSPGLRPGFSLQRAPSARTGLAMGSPPPPIHIRSPPRNINEEWHPPPQTPTRSLSLSARPSAMPQLPTNMNQVQFGHSHSASNQSQTPSHTRSDSTSSTTGLITAPGRTRSFSGNRPSPFKLNPGNQVYPGPPGTKSDIPHRALASKFSDNGDGDDNDKDGADLAKKGWIVHFAVPLTLCLLFLCGLMSAALHHIFYGQLHGTSPSREFQQWHTRAGIAIAVFTVACWIGCTAICYKQRVWSTLTQKNVKISGIDALWGLVHNPSLFLVREAWRKSRVAMGLGIIMWILPLTTIFVPGALTIRPSTHDSSQGCLIPTFTPPSADQSLLSPAEIDRLLGSQPTKDVPLTALRSGSIVLTAAVKRIATTTAISGQVPDYPLPEGCGNQGNCTYTTSFTAPGYKCDVVTAEDARKNGPWGPVGFDRIFAPASGGMKFYSTRADNRTKSSASTNKTATDITSEERFGFGRFWVAVRSLGEEFTDADPSLLLDPTKAKKEMYKDQIFQCSDYVVSYENVKFNYVEGRMSVQLSNAADQGIRYITPVDYTQYSKNNGKDVTDAAIFSRVAHEYTLSLLIGEMVATKSEFSSTSQILGTELVDRSRFFGSADGTGIADKCPLPSADLKSKVEELHRNVTLSLLSEPRLMGTYFTSATCKSSTNGLIYKYSSFALLLSYGLACFFTTIAIIVGVIALRANGFATDFSFSRILCTTRNPTLDGTTRGESCLGSVTERVRRQELRFGEIWIKGGRKNREKRGLGVVMEDDGVDLEEGGHRRYGNVGHAAFGLPSEVMSLRKGRGYA